MARGVTHRDQREKPEGRRCAAVVRCPPEARWERPTKPKGRKLVRAAFQLSKCHGKRLLHALTEKRMDCLCRRLVGCYLWSRPPQVSPVAVAVEGA